MLQYIKKISNRPRLIRYHNYYSLRISIEQALAKSKESIMITLPISKAQPTVDILNLLVKFGILSHFTERGTLSVNKKVELFFNYSSTGRAVSRGIRLLSSGGNLRYIKVYHLKALKSAGTILSSEYILLTKAGVLTGKQALELNIGGLLLYHVNY